MHASRTDRRGAEASEGVRGEKSSRALEGVGALVLVSGERVSNTWVICPREGNNCSKGQLIPHKVRRESYERSRETLLGEEPAAD